MLRKTIPATGKKTLPKCLDFCLVYDANFTNNPYYIIAVSVCVT